jgi:hypothetical protein
VAADRVYLHVGAPKTGTTYLQALLAANRATLKAHGILYPKSTGEAHHTAAWDLRGTPPQREGARGIEGAWDKLVQRANAWDGAAVIVSSELFVYCDDKQIRAALGAFDGEMHVVYTARDLLRQVPAVWQERVKNQQTLSYAEFLRAVTRSAKGSGGQAFWRAQDAAGVAERWSVGLPPEHVHIVTAPPVGSPPAVLWDRFASVFGAGGDSYSTATAGSANRSLGMLQTELLRRYNERHGSGLSWPVYRRTIRVEVDRSFAAAISDPRKIELPRADVAFFAAAARDIADRLRRGRYDIVGALDDLLPSDGEAPAAGAGNEPTVATEEELLGAALDVLHAVLSRDGEDRAQRRMQRRTGES